MLETTPFLSAQERLLEDATKNNMHELVEHIQIYRQMVRTSLVPRLLPDFISQLWRNIGFLRSCEIKSWEWPGMRLGMNITY